MTLDQFKKLRGEDDFHFYKSTVTSRYVAGLNDGSLLVTTEEFDPKSKDLYVYKHPESDDCWILSNKVPRDPDFVL